MKNYYSKKYVQYAGHSLLPTIEYIESFFPKKHLENVYLIACQHILPSTHMMIRSMINLGLSLDRVAVIGKCYSTDQTVMENMLNEGIFVCPSSSEFDSNLSFDQQFRDSVSIFLQTQIQKMQPDRYAKVIILDDGGILISAAQNLFEHYPNICGVEQTSSGYRKLEAISLKFPVVNVAQSNTKLDFECPLIAKSIIHNLEKKINISSSTPKDILLIGNGPIGTALYKTLKSEYNQHHTTIYDAVKERSEINYPDFINFDLIIGATGNKTISHNYYDSFKDGTVLTSVSSSDREFDAVNFRKSSGKKWGIHDDVLHNGLRLLNCGFPLNFSGGKGVSVPLMQIQLICALLFLGVCESAIHNILNGQFVELNKNFITDVLEKFPITA